MDVSDDSPIKILKKCQKCDWLDIFFIELSFRRLLDSRTPVDFSMKNR